MSTKIKLGSRPKNFKPFPVRFEMPDGTEGVINVTYKYRTREEFGQFMNEISGDDGEVFLVDGKFDWEKLYKAQGVKNADHLLSAMDAWDVDGAELSRESLVQLSNEIPAGVIALMAAYRQACVEGRLGN